MKNLCTQTVRILFITVTIFNLAISEYASLNYLFETATMSHPLRNEEDVNKKVKYYCLLQRAWAWLLLVVVVLLCIHQAPARKRRQHHQQNIEEEGEEWDMQQEQEDQEQHQVVVVGGGVGLTAGACGPGAALGSSSRRSGTYSRSRRTRSSTR